MSVEIQKTTPFQRNVGLQLKQHLPISMIENKIKKKKKKKNSMILIWDYQHKIV